MFDQSNCRQISPWRTGRKEQLNSISSELPKFHSLSYVEFVDFCEPQKHRQQFLHLHLHLHAFIQIQRSNQTATVRPTSNAPLWHPQTSVHGRWTLASLSKVFFNKSTLPLIVRTTERQRRRVLTERIEKNRLDRVPHLSFLQERPAK